MFLKMKQFFRPKFSLQDGKNCLKMKQLFWLWGIWTWGIWRRFSNTYLIIFYRIAVFDNFFCLATVLILSKIAVCEFYIKQIGNYEEPYSTAELQSKLIIKCVDLYGKIIEWVCASMKNLKKLYRQLQFDCWCEFSVWAGTACSAFGNDGACCRLHPSFAHGDQNACKIGYFIVFKSVYRNLTF